MSKEERDAILKKQQVAAMASAARPSHICQIFEPKDTVYSFSAKVLDVRKIYKYNTREMRNFPVTRIVASVISVARGKEMLTDQAIFIDLAPQRRKCIVGEICNFVAPRALKSDTTETIQVLDAIIVIGN